jgi:hypothetical protein
MLDVVVVVTAATAMSLVVGGVLPLLRVVRLLVLSKIVVAPPLAPCQICGKVGHRAIRCWYRMDDSYQEESPSAAWPPHIHTRWIRTGTVTLALQIT